MAHSQERCLEAAGLTRPGKRAMSAAKLEHARLAVRATVARLCASPECSASLADGREVVTVIAQNCEFCGGSEARRAAIRPSEVCRRRGLQPSLRRSASPASRDR